MDVYNTRRDDPLADIRRGVRWAIGLGALGVAASLLPLLA